MAKVWEPKDIDLLISWKDAVLNEASDELNDWENSFIESISLKLDRRNPLTERQEEILERIYAEKTK